MMVFLHVLMLLALTANVLACNSIYCASVISNCMIDTSCQTESCRREFMSCLSDFYDDCCSCVNLCPLSTRNKRTIEEKTKSSVAILDGLPENLFQELASGSDKTWSTVTFPIDYDVVNNRPKLQQNFNYYMKIKSEDVPLTVPINCTVVYLNTCLSYNKCKETCLKIGSGSFRWFSDACCECASPECIIDYGINESRCSQCPPQFNDELMEDQNQPAHFEDANDFMDFEAVQDDFLSY